MFASTSIQERNSAHEVMPTAWHGCATKVALLCHRSVMVVSPYDNSCAISEYCRSPVVILNVYVKVLWMSNSAILENSQYSLLFGGSKETFTFADPVVGSPAKKTH